MLGPDPSALNKAPLETRNIDGGHNEYNVILGPAMLGFSKFLHKNWSFEVFTHWMYYTSGSTAESLSDWIHHHCCRLGIDFETCAKLICDQSRQDAHVSEEALLFEHWLLRKIGISEDIMEILEQCLDCIGYSRFGVYFRRAGSRNTGDHHTSSGNSNMNGILTLFALYLIAVKLAQWNWANPPLAISMQGDDSLSLLHDTLAKIFPCDDFVNTWKKYGFKVRFCVIERELHKIDYCSRYFWPTDTHPLGFVAGPKPGKVLSKIGWSAKYVRDHYKHNRAIALGLQNSVSHVPFLREYVRRLLELTEGLEVTPDYNPYSIHSETGHTYCSRTWEFLGDLYGLTRDDVRKFEMLLQSIKSLPTHVHVPCVDTMVWVDLQ